MTFGLGNKFDIASAFAPGDAVAGALTGLRVHLRNYAAATLVVTASAGSTNQLSLNALQEHTASTGGTSTNLAIITQYYYRDATTIAGSEQWSVATQAAAATITTVGSASAQQLLVVEVDAGSLDDGYEWVSATVPDLGSNGNKYVAGLWILHGLRYGRKPSNLPAPLT